MRFAIDVLPKLSQIQTAVVFTRRENEKLKAKSGLFPWKHPIGCQFLTEPQDRFGKIAVSVYRKGKTLLARKPLTSFRPVMDSDIDDLPSLEIVNRQPDLFS